MTKSNRHIKLIPAYLFLLIILSIADCKQCKAQCFKGHFYEKNENIHLLLNLYDQELNVPNMEFIGKVHGYMHGNIYGIWLLTKFSIKDNVATLRFSHDSGADAQSVEVKLVNDSTLLYKTLNGNAVRRVSKRKLAKIPSELEFTRKK